MNRPPLVVVHHDARLVVIDKPAGLLVHRSPLDAHEGDTVVDRLQHQLGERLRPAHRLDKGSSGLLVLARDAEAARVLGAAFDPTGAGSSVVKRYRALVRGWPGGPDRGEGLIDHPLARDPERPSAGQPRLAARTRWQVLARLEWPFAVGPAHARSRYAVVLAWPESGRRHQIRRHFKHIGHPLVGDSTHGKGAHNRAVAAWLGVSRLWLHAEALTLPHPDDGRPLALLAPAGPEWDRLQSARPAE